MEKVLPKGADTNFRPYFFPMSLVGQGLLSDEVKLWEKNSFARASAGGPATPAAHPGPPSSDKSLKKDDYLPLKHFGIGTKPGQKLDDPIHDTNRERVTLKSQSILTT